MMSNYPQIAIKTTSGLKIIRQEDISYCAAEGSYAEIFLTENNRLLFSKHLGGLEKKLDADLFIRIHSKYLVNRFCISEVRMNGKCLVVLLDGTELEVSSRRKAELLGRFERL